MTKLLEVQVTNGKFGDAWDSWDPKRVYVVLKTQSFRSHTTKLPVSFLGKTPLTTTVFDNLRELHERIATEACPGLLHAGRYCQKAV